MVQKFYSTRELKSLEWRTRKFMTIHRALHSKSDFNRVYLCREMKRNRLISCEGCIRMEENKLGWYVRKSVEPLIEGVRAAETIAFNDTMNKKKIQTEQDDGEERIMKKQKNVWNVCRIKAWNNIWKRNMEMAEKRWLKSWNGSCIMCWAWTDNSN